MDSLKTMGDPLYEEFLNSTWVVNKIYLVPFCAIGADHSLEHINRSMKVSGGIVRIIRNPTACLKFLLISPELTWLSKEAKDIARLSSMLQTHHHGLSKSIVARHDRNIQELISAIRGFTNPFTEEAKELHNIVTKAVMPEGVRQDLISEPDIGTNLAEKFIAEHLTIGTVNFWAPLKKRNN